jgi:hypothetical protein
MPEDALPKNALHRNPVKWSDFSTEIEGHPTNIRDAAELRDIARSDRWLKAMFALASDRSSKKWRQIERNKNSGIPSGELESITSDILVKYLVYVEVLADQLFAKGDKVTTLDLMNKLAKMINGISRYRAIDAGRTRSVVIIPGYKKEDWKKAVDRETAAQGRPLTIEERKRILRTHPRNYIHLDAPRRDGEGGLTPDFDPAAHMDPAWGDGHSKSPEDLAIRQQEEEKRQQEEEKRQQEEEKRQQLRKKVIEKCDKKFLDSIKVGDDRARTLHLAAVEYQNLVDKGINNGECKRIAIKYNITVNDLRRHREKMRRWLHNELKRIKKE